MTSTVGFLQNFRVFAVYCSMQDNLADNLASSRSRPSFWYDTNGQSVQCQGEGGHARSWGLCRVPSCMTSILTNRRCMEMFCDYATLPSVSLCNMVTCAHCATPQNKRRSFVAPGLPDTCQDLCSVISTQAHEFQEIAKHWNCLFSSILLCNENCPRCQERKPSQPKTLSAVSGFTSLGKPSKKNIFFVTNVTLALTPPLPPLSVTKNHQLFLVKNGLFRGWNFFSLTMP